MIYQEITNYSPILDRNVTRLSTVDERESSPSRGAEYFCIVPRGHAKAWREIKESALSQLDQAIERGEEPGEITIRLDA